VYVDVAEAVGEGVLLGVFEAGRVAVRSGVFVAVADAVEVEVNVCVGVLVGVDDGVYVIVGVNVTVGGLPVKVKDPEVFHSLPIKICTS
jgi:hypothetical protein